jgi:hypothetical protein
MMRTLQIEFLDYWHAGGGRGAGSHLDAIVERDGRDLPYVPGRQIKGLLREAMEALEHWQQVPAGMTDAIFGRPALTGQISLQGSIGFSDAGLPAAEADWLSERETGSPHDADARNARAALYRDLFATAIDSDTGSAKSTSLRGIEVVIPLTLEAAISVLPGKTPPAAWEQQLAKTFILVRAVGAHRSRGLGRATLAWKTGESAQ